MSHVIVIGGGVAGLTAGIYCRKAGFSCDIFERHSVAGGNLTGWKRNGATIDNCIHWLTGTLPGNALHDIWLETGMLEKDTPLYRGKHLYESRFGGQSVALCADLEETRRQMLAVSPEDEKEIDRFIGTVKALIPIIGVGSLWEKSSILAKVPNVVRYWKTNLYGVADRFRHPLLKRLMTDYIGGEFSAMALLCAYTAFVSGNGSVPMGGSPKAAKRMTEKFLSLDGVLHLGVSVERIAVRGQSACGILTAEGEFFPADVVISACDPTVTFGKLLPSAWMPKRLRERINDPKTPIFSSLHAAFLCDKKDFVPFDTCVVDAPYFSVRSGGRLPIKEFSHEPDSAPEGKVLLETLVFQLEEECRDWIDLAVRDPAAYREKKDQVGEGMAEAIRLAFPALAPSLECIDVWTPATYHRYFDSNAGAYLSYALTPQASLFQLPNTIPQLDNFYLATQWLRSPGGLPLAALSGVAVAKKIATGAKFEKKEEIYKGTF